MKAKDIVVLLVAIAVLYLASRMLFPPLMHVDIALTGTPGAKIKGRYECDGVSFPFMVVLPSTISFTARHNFAFRAKKEDPNDTLSVVLTSDASVNSGGPVNAGPSETGIFVDYRSAFHGLSGSVHTGPTL